MGAGHPGSFNQWGNRERRNRRIRDIYELIEVGKAHGEMGTAKLKKIGNSSTGHHGGESFVLSPGGNLYGRFFQGKALRCSRALRFP